MLPVRVTPRSSRNRIEVNGTQVKVWVSASPTDGQANEAVCELLAKCLGLAPLRVAISRGHTSRDKVVIATGITVEDALAKLKGS